MSSIDGFENIKTLLHNKNNEMTLKYNSIKKSILVRNNTNNIPQAGFYIVTCKRCDSMYIGKMERDLEIRQ